MGYPTNRNNFWAEIYSFVSFMREIGSLNEVYTSIIFFLISKVSAK